MGIPDRGTLINGYRGKNKTTHTHTHTLRAENRKVDRVSIATE